ncbi:MAG: PDZ domain-containing protein [Chitinophagales bacterium]|nr:PDZ domain-containing protein [Chitinophagales bacterium]HAE14547.1 hypothetical protein [Bacteroidota bacterium]MCB9031919.1 PDZ domain-containing protein [Chitinophagales bacterium]HAE35213.1 hypothetical protein [Bacteroidota bacterium]HQU38828.1 PDZ domain-containing protein [Chitinophagales bacterium]
MKAITKWTSGTVMMLAVLIQLPASAQENDQIRLKIDANVNGQHIQIDTTIEQMEDFDLQQYLRELGLEEEMDGLQTMDIRIRDNSDHTFFNFDELENAEWANDLKLHLESIDMPEMPELPAMGHVMFFNGNKAFLGVVTDNTKSRDGVLVNEVVENSAAAAAGLQRGDIITMINDKTVESTNNLIEILSTYQPGEVINVTYLRDDSKQQATATLKENEGYFESAEWEQYGERWEEWGEAFEKKMENLGDDFQMRWESNMADVQKPFLGVYLNEHDQGAEITGVSEGSAAEAAGLQKGDIITAIDGITMETTRQVSDYIRSKQIHDEVSVTVLRQGTSIQIPAILGKHNSDLLFWMDDEKGVSPLGNEERHIFFSPGNGNCHSYSYELNDDGKKTIIITMDLENEQSSSTDSARTGNVFRAEDVEFYPNPSNGTFNLRFAVEEPSDVLVQIRDARGNMVYEENLENYSGTYDHTISLGNEAKGNYFINIVRGDYIITKQIVIQ